MSAGKDIGFLLQHLTFVLGRHSDQVLQEQLGIGFSQFKILMILNWHPNIRQKQVAERLGQTEASISRQIKLMSQVGLLQSTVHPLKKREHVTRLTHKGERVIDHALAILNRYHAPMFNTLSSKELDKLQEYLSRLHGHACPNSHMCMNE
jgi:DNA-binding MarR family transcriptional regulator